MLNLAITCVENFLGSRIDFVVTCSFKVLKEMKHLDVQVIPLVYNDLSHGKLVLYVFLFVCGKLVPAFCEWCTQAFFPWLCSHLGSFTCSSALPLAPMAQGSGKCDMIVTPEKKRPADVENTPEKVQLDVHFTVACSCSKMF